MDMYLPPQDRSSIRLLVQQQVAIPSGHSSLLLIRWRRLLITLQSALTSYLIPGTDMYLPLQDRSSIRLRAPQQVVIPSGHSSLLLIRWRRLLITLQSALTSYLIPGTDMYSLLQDRSSIRLL